MHNNRVRFTFTFLDCFECIQDQKLPQIVVVFFLFLLH